MCHFGKIQFSVDLKITGKNTQFKIKLKSEVKKMYSYERNKTLKNNKKQKLKNNIKQKKCELLQNEQNVHMTILH